MATYRVCKDKNNPYVMLHKYGIYDSSLSWKAKGLLMYFISRPDDWQFHGSEIEKHAKDGRDATRAGIQELIKYGYVRKVRNRDDKGKFKGWLYEIYEVPLNYVKKNNNDITEEPETQKAKQDIQKLKKPKSDMPKTEKPKEETSKTEKPKSENTLLINNDDTNKLSKLNKDNNNNKPLSSSDDVLEACKYYEKAGFSTVNMIILDKISSLVEIYSYIWVKDAIDTAVLNNRRTLNYVEGILKNWKANGKEKRVKNYDHSGNNRKNKEKGEGKWNGYRPPKSKRYSNDNSKGLI